MSTINEYIAASDSGKSTIFAGDAGLNWATAQSGKNYIEAGNASNASMSTPQSVRGKSLGRAIYKLVFYALARATMAGIFTTQAVADDHIKITREILLEGGTAVKPHTITQTRDGGYVIVGTKGRAWATRVDSEGKVQWRHEAHVAERGEGEYMGAAVLPDDSTILSGYHYLPAEAPGKISGLLTHIDKGGAVISQRLIEPHDRQQHGLTRLNACVSVGNEVLMLGGTYSRGSNYPSSWIVTLDAKGNVTHEKQLPEPGGKIESIRVMTTSNEVVVTTTSWAAESAPHYTARLVSRLASNGDVKAQEIFPDSTIQAIPTFADPLIRLVPWTPRRAEISVLDANLKVINRAKGSVDAITSSEPIFCQRAPWSCSVSSDTEGIA
jgi:hypothetical protein